jgi:predicted nuclease of predicted toxin-antitoxin system
VKLLLDQNLSPRLVRTLETVFPGSSHVRLVGLRDADDAVVWEFARDHDFIILSTV